MGHAIEELARFAADTPWETIPKAVRAAKAWTAGQEFAFIPKGDGVLLVPVPKPEELAGSAKR